MKPYPSSRKVLHSAPRLGLQGGICTPYGVVLCEPAIFIARYLNMMDIVMFYAWFYLLISALYSERNLEEIAECRNPSAADINPDEHRPPTSLCTVHHASNRRYHRPDGPKVLYQACHDFRPSHLPSLVAMDVPLMYATAYIIVDSGPVGARALSPIKSTFLGEIVHDRTWEMHYRTGQTCT